MKNTATITLLTALLLGGLLTFAVPAGFAEEEGHTCPHGCIPNVFEKGTVTGVNYCFACTMKAEHGAAADCKTYGHRHALKVVKFVDACGNEKAEFEGKTLFYLDNEKSHDLVTANDGERVEVTGKIYLDRPVIEVESYKKAPKT